MSVGANIKKFRTELGMTQNELADKLHITYQAISRWENDDAEPSFDSLVEMSKIFNCSMDDLFGTKKEESEKPDEVVTTQVVEKVIVQESKPILAICDHCKKAIYDENDLVRTTEKERVRFGRGYKIEDKKIVLCKKCNAEKVKKEKEIEEAKRRNFRYDIEKKRRRSFIWPTLAAVVFLIISLVNYINKAITAGTAYLVIGILLFLFLSCLILDNNFIAEMWLEISSWGFVKLPGVIFELSFDGIIFLILTKILLFILGIILAVGAAALATGLAMIVSVFVYPFALKKNLKYVE